MKLSHISLALIATFFLGTNMVAVKIGVAHFPPVFMMAIRFTLVTLVLVWFVKPPTGEWWPLFGISVTMGTLHFGLFFAGIAGTDAAVTAIIFQLGIPFGVMFAWVLLGERFGWRRGGGIAVAFLGVALIAGSPESRSSLFHMGLVFASVMAWGLAAVQIKKLKDVDAMSLAAWMALFSTPQLFIVSLILESGQWESVATAQLLHWAVLAYAALGASIIGYGLWYFLISKYDVSLILPFALLNPVFAIVAAMIILDEAMTPVRIAGAVLTLIGVAVVQLRGRQRQLPES